jgi:hypothetical protein
MQFLLSRRRRFDLPIGLEEEPILVPRVVELDLGANEKSHWLGGVPYPEKQRAGWLVPKQSARSKEGRVVELSLGRPQQELVHSCCSPRDVESGDAIRMLSNQPWRTLYPAGDFLRGVSTDDGKHRLPW